MEGLLDQIYIRVLLPLSFFFSPKEDACNKLITCLDVWWTIAQTEVKTTVILQLLLLLSHFSRVQLCATPETAAYQAPLSLGFSGKNTGVGCHFLLQGMKVKGESEVAQSCPTLSDPMDCSLPGSSIHRIFQARVLEWGAIAFSWFFNYTSINKQSKQTKSCHDSHDNSVFIWTPIISYIVLLFDLFRPKL